MRPRNLKSRLLVGASALVIGSGLLISSLVSQRYSRSLFESLTAQAGNLAHAVALEAADKILINDLVALQKMLDHQKRSNASIAYLFVQRNGQVIAHTFPGGIPAELLDANTLAAGDQMRFQKIASTSGEHYLDIAWPIFGGEAGTLRLGMSEQPYRQQLARLWLQMSGLTLAILLLALTVTLLFVRRITRPLAALAEATERIEQGQMEVTVHVEGNDEIGRLAASFNHMVSRVADYTRRLEEQTLELDRAHHQTRAVCRIVQEIGARRSLAEIGSFLIGKFQETLKCGEGALLLFNGDRDLLFTVWAGNMNVLRDLKLIQSAAGVLENVKAVKLTEKNLFKPPLVPGGLAASPRQSVVPCHYENQLLGALIVTCPRDCRCNPEDLEVVRVMLSQAAGTIRRALLQEEEIHRLQARLETSGQFSGIVGKDPRMQVIYGLIEDIAPTEATVLIQGESGTGKELVARAIHKLSPRQDKPFIVINCSAYPATLIESELFGHEKGAFTGAIRQKSGRFEQAHGGTVFLDEIGEIPLSAQIKLLRVLQTQKFERVGGEKTVAVNVRILAATNKNLLEEVKNGNFREDLYYRLNVIPIHLPPLRERRNDIPLLARHFLERFAAAQGKRIVEFSPEAMRLILDYAWPGNVRELENIVEHATVLAKSGRIEALDLPAALHTVAVSPGETRAPSTIVEHEKKLLREALEGCGWNKKEAARRLGISRSTLYDKIRRYRIARPTTH
jgi:transcriptional regulator with GAF, ATPase, and Fis domain